MSPALAGGFFTTEPPRKPLPWFCWQKKGERVPVRETTTGPPQLIIPVIPAALFLLWLREDVVSLRAFV